MESIIVAIVIGIIVNIFNRFSDNEKDKKSPGPVARLPETNKKKTVSELKQAVEEVKVEIAPPSRQLEQRIGSVRQERLKVKEERPSSYEIEEDDLLKGIIFSQVLSPPKARRRK